MSNHPESLTHTSGSLLPENNKENNKNNTLQRLWMVMDPGTRETIHGT